MHSRDDVSVEPVTCSTICRESIDRPCDRFRPVREGRAEPERADRRRRSTAPGSADTRSSGRVLPVSAETTPGAVRDALAETEPRSLLLLGVAPGRAALAVGARRPSTSSTSPSRTTTARCPSTCRSRSTAGRLLRDAATPRDRRGVARGGHPRLSLRQRRHVPLQRCDVHRPARDGGRASPGRFPPPPEPPCRSCRTAPAGAEHAARDPDRGVRIALEATRRRARASGSPVCRSVSRSTSTHCRRGRSRWRAATWPRCREASSARSPCRASWLCSSATASPATFFVPGHTALAYPELVREIRDAGHELGHHGWVHEPLSQLAPGQERELLLRGLDALDRWQGSAARLPRAERRRERCNTVEILARARLPVRRLVLGLRFRAVLPATRDASPQAPNTSSARPSISSASRSRGASATSSTSSSCPASPGARTRRRRSTRSGAAELEWAHAQRSRRRLRPVYAPAGDRQGPRLVMVEDLIEAATGARRRRVRAAGGLRRPLAERASARRVASEQTGPRTPLAVSRRVRARRQSRSSTFLASTGGSKPR